MTEWSVHLEAVLAEPLDPEDSHVDKLVDLMVEHHGSVGAGGTDNVVAVTITVEASSARDAIEVAHDSFALALEKAGLAIPPPHRIEAIRTDLRDAELERSNFPDILGTTEVAHLLGVSRQRIRELRTAGRFPQPIVEIAAGPMWLRPGIEAYLATWPRRPGRPRSRQTV